MSRNYAQRASLRPKCPFGGKTRYPSEKAAKHARGVVAKNGNNTNEMRIYKCPNCYDYHFTRRKD